MLELLRADNRVKVVIDEHGRFSTESFKGGGWQAKTLIMLPVEAITARQRIRLKPAWGKPVYWILRSAAPKASPEFRIVALPSGYAYRSGSACHIGIGFVGRGECLIAGSRADTAKRKLLVRECPSLPR